MKTKILTILTVVIALILQSCGGKPQKNRTQSDTESENYTKIEKRKPIFSLFDSTGKPGYQIFRNDEKLATFTLDSGRYPIDMRCFKGDCYILISESPKNTSGTKYLAEIYKNGKAAMSFEKNLHTIAFEIYNGHFYVLGTLNDSLHVVYRDGSKVLSFNNNNVSKPVGLGIFGQDIFIAMQNADKISIYKNHTHQFDLYGQCKEFKVSYMGIYTLTNDTLFRDKEGIMAHQYYRFINYDMFANPTSFDLGDDISYVAAQAIYKDSKYYACVFKNREAHTTIKPDDKPIGESPVNSYCAGVALSGQNSYYVTVNVDDNLQPIKPNSYHFYYDTEEKFKLEFKNGNAKLLMMDSE